MLEVWKRQTLLQFIIDELVTSATVTAAVCRLPRQRQATAAYKSSHRQNSTQPKGSKHNSLPPGERIDLYRYLFAIPLDGVSSLEMTDVVSHYTQSRRQQRGVQKAGEYRHPPAIITACRSVRSLAFITETFMYERLVALCTGGSHAA